jgi:hypothetical protein
MPVMKMMVEWTTRPAHSYTDDIANREALLRTFSKWAPPEGLTIHAFVVKLEAQAGYILVECDDPKLMASFQLQFMPWNDVKIVPVLDVQDAVPLYDPAFSWSRTSAEG